MAPLDVQSANRDVWRLVRAQHGVITFVQLRELGFSAEAIKHRVAVGRLHRVHRGVYAVGRPDLGRRGRWMAAVLACGQGAALSDESAAELMEILDEDPGRAITVSVPPGARPRVKGVRVRRRSAVVMAQAGECHGIPVLSPLCVLVDLAASSSADAAEAAVNAADRLDLIRVDVLRERLAELTGVPGCGVLGRMIDRLTFTFTDSGLERHFRPIARRCGLDGYETQQWINGYRVDFVWRELRLIVETDGLTYHRTPAQQARDLEREQLHTATGWIPLRFTHGQIRWQKPYVERILTTTRRRLDV